MAKRDGASIHIYFFRIEAKLARDGDSGDGKSFVEFDEVDILVAIPAGFCEEFFDSFYRRHHHPFWLDATYGLRDDSRHRSLPETRGIFFAGDDDGGCTVIRAGRVPCRDGAILFECGLQLCERFERGVFAWRFVGLDDDGVALLLRDFDWHDLFAEEARFDRANRFLVALVSELILFLARDVVLFGDEFAGDAHVEVFVHVPEAVVNHGIDEILIAKAESAAGALQKIRAIRHGLHAASDDDLGFAENDALRCERD